MKKLTDFEIGYICGIFDAEGSCSAHKQEHNRKMSDGTVLFFYNQRIHINMNDARVVKYIHDRFNQIKLKHSHYGPDSQRRYSIDLQDIESVKRFWQIFDCFKRLKPVERHIGCVIDESN